MSEGFEIESPELGNESFLDLESPGSIEALDRKGPPEEREVAIFDPEEELRKIKGLSRQEKRQKLEEFKEKLAKQMETLASLQENIISIIQKNPDVSLKDLTQEVEKIGKEVGLTDRQKTIAKTILIRYQQEHEAVRRARQRFPDDRELYKNLFGYAPKGEIEMMKGPMTLYFRCYDLEDYARIYLQPFVKKGEVRKTDLIAASISGGVTIRTVLIPELSVTIIAENVRRVPLEEREKLKTHEEQHAIKRLFRDTINTTLLHERVFKIEDKEACRLMMENYFRGWRENVEEQIKNEILAYLKSGEDPAQTYSLLIQPGREGGIYDYLEENREKKVPQFIAEAPAVFKEVIIGAAKTVFIDEYQDMIARGISSFIFLTEKLRYSPEKVTALLVAEPLIKWPKAVKRLWEEQEKQRQK